MTSKDYSQNEPAIQFPKSRCLDTLTASSAGEPFRDYTGADKARGVHVAVPTINRESGDIDRGRGGSCQTFCSQARPSLPSYICIRLGALLRS